MARKLKEYRKFVLVYQAGMANVFEVDCFNMCNPGRNARRVLQGTFENCEAFARGLVEAGAHVCSAACNMAGDIAEQKWYAQVGPKFDDNCPFRDKIKPVNQMFSKDIWEEEG